MKTTAWARDPAAGSCPKEVIRAQVDPEWGSVNRKTFEAVKHQFDSWARYDNSGAAPVLADTGRREEGV